METWAKGLPYVAATASAGWLGAALVLFWQPRPATRAYLLHFAAGAILAATAVELFPEIERLAGGRHIDLGAFALGGICMFLLSQLSETLGRRWPGPVGLVLAGSADVFLDGVILGATLSVGRGLGFALAIALAAELMFLVLSVGSDVRASGRSPRHSAGVAALITLGFAAGGIGGLLALAAARPTVLASVLAFGAAIFLYLVTEELLVEAHKEKQRKGISILVFFLGFLAIFAVETMG